MRCYCCNRNLSDYESTMKHPVTKQYLDTCTTCLADTGIEPVTRRDLKEEKFKEDDDLFDEMYADDDELEEDDETSQ